MDNCPICNGQKEYAKITFSVDLGETIVVVRDTPAMVCSLCGEEWIDDAVAQDLENVVNEAQKRHRMIEVVSFGLEKAA